MSKLIVNMNGDTAADLEKQFSDVLVAAEALCQALNKVECHGRNYPNGGQGGDILYRRTFWSSSNDIKNWALDMVLHVRKSAGVE